MADLSQLLADFGQFGDSLAVPEDASEALPRTDELCLVGNRKGGASQAAEELVRAGAGRHDSLYGRSPFWSAVPRCGAAFLPASLLAGSTTESIIAGQQAGSGQSGPATRDRTPKLRSGAWRHHTVRGRCENEAAVDSSRHQVLESYRQTLCRLSHTFFSYRPFRLSTLDPRLVQEGGEFQNRLASVLSQKYGYIVFQSWPESYRPWLSRQRVGIGCWRSARIDRFSLPVP